MKLFTKVVTATCGLGGIGGLTLYLLNNSSSKIKDYSSVRKEEYAKWVTNRVCQGENDDC